MDNEVEHINAKGSLDETTIINHEKLYQGANSSLGHHKLNKLHSRSKFMNQTSQNRKKIVISKDKVSYNNNGSGSVGGPQLFSPSGQSSNGA
jgi:hypothetical protein